MYEKSDMHGRVQTTSDEKPIYIHPTEREVFQSDYGPKPVDPPPPPPPPADSGW